MILPCTSLSDTIYANMKSAGSADTGAELSGHFGTSLMVPKCLGYEVRSVLAAKCLDTFFVTGQNGRTGLAAA